MILIRMLGTFFFALYGVLRAGSVLYRATRMVF